MRILKLQFTNLNSLAGTWRIDFTHPAYTGGGIFAITGPTGAGKSTILDAVCLALYGKTPRLRSVNAGENEIMSRLTAGCSSEVTFQTQGGTYRCTWSQKLAHGKTDGKRQAAMHEIVDVANGNEILASQKGSVASKIVEITGMDYDQFTRSMLLAQGGFASFLQADASDRGRVLEQITGTAIYSQISMYVFERFTREKAAFREVELELGGMEPMTGDALDAVRRELSEHTAHAAAFAGEEGRLRTAAAWLEGIDALCRDADAIDARWKDFEARNAAAGVLREKLALAKKSASVEQFYAPVRTLRQQLLNNRRDLAAASEQLPALEKAQGEAEARLIAQRASRDALKQRLAAESELWKQARRLDASVLEKRRRCGELYDSRAEIRQRQDGLRSVIAEQEHEIDRLTVRKSDAQKYYTEYAADAALAGSMAMIDKMADSLRTKAAKRLELDAQAAGAASAAAARASALEEMRHECDSTRQQAGAAVLTASGLGDEIRVLLRGKDIGEHRALFERASERATAIDEALRLQAEMKEAARVLEAIAAERQAHTHGLEKGRALVLDIENERLRLQADIDRSEAAALRAAAIQSLDAQRAHLIDGQPCPLCGSPEHPFSRQTPEPQGENISVLKGQKAEMRKLAETLTAYNVRIGTLETDIRHCDARAAEKNALLTGHTLRCAELCGAIGAECSVEALTAGAAHMRTRKNELQALLSAVEKKSAEEANAGRARDTVTEALHACEHKVKDAQFLLTQADDEERRLNENRRDLQLDIEKTLHEIREAAAPYGPPAVTVETADQVCALLRARLATWTEKAAEKESIAAGIDDALSAKKSDEAVHANLAVQEAKIVADISLCEADCTTLEAERATSYGIKDPDVEERALNAALDQAELAVVKAHEDAAASRNDALTVQTRMHSLIRQMGMVEGDLQTAEKELGGSLSAAGFGSEEEFTGALIPAGEREGLQERIDALRDEGTTLEGLRAHKRDEVKREREKDLTRTSAETLRHELALMDEKISASQQAIGSLEQRLKDNEALLRARAEKESTLAIRKREYERWNALSELIGSRDGKRFQTIAQAITFERMVALANGVLTKMSPRYYLRCDDKANLEMNIVDLYQAGEIRSTKNLSGGESFIVSLSLALGLSQMASRNVRVDSLFLDEGFGTLDEDALDTALTTLSELQQDGKCIGVISHVGALKERIAVQIVVTPGTGGRSRLSGPGCSSV